jgi:hypothetical protein
LRTPAGRHSSIHHQWFSPRSAHRSRSVQRVSRHRHLRIRLLEPDDTTIGQQLERLVEVVDYIPPMVYPASFQFGISVYRNPVHPYEIVHRSLERALERTRLPPVRFRPWLQAFPDYAFGGRSFTAGEVRAQIRASEDIGTNGWMLWNPHNRYSRTDVTETAATPTIY